MAGRERRCGRWWRRRAAIRRWWTTRRGCRGLAMSRPSTAAADGLVAAIDAERIGRAAVLLGAGRDRAGDPVDHAAGIRLRVAAGDRVTRGTPLLDLHYNDATRLDDARALATEALAFGPPPAPVPLVRAWVHRDGETLSAMTAPVSTHRPAGARRRRRGVSARPRGRRRRRGDRARLGARRLRRSSRTMPITCRTARFRIGRRRRSSAMPGCWWRAGWAPAG